MKKILFLLSFAFIFRNAIAQQSTTLADTIVVGTIEKSCPGGFEGFNLFIMKKVHPPAIAFEDHKVGTTFVSFIIEPDGKVSNVCTILAAGSGMDEEAIRVIRSSMNWIPATVDNKPVGTLCRVGVRFFGDFEKQLMWVRARQID